MKTSFIFVIFAALIAAAAPANAADPKPELRSMELVQPPIDWGDINRIWRLLKNEVGAPENFPPPPIVLDWDVPWYGRMGFQYPTAEHPEWRLQISIAPRTIDMYLMQKKYELILFGIGHELAHYLFLLRHNRYDLTLKIFDPGRPHHCDKEFVRVTRRIAQEIWNIYHSDDALSQMRLEVERSCRDFPQQ